VKRAKKPKKPKLAPSTRPHQAIILAVDPGENSGWSIWDRGLLCEWGEVDVFDAAAVVAVLEKALEWYADPAIKCVLAIERPFQRRAEQGGFNTTTTGTADKIWRTHAQRAGFSKRVARVYPATWRARVLGSPWHMAKREAVREHEQKRAPQVVADNGFDRGDADHRDPGPDACPAILIGKWATHAGEVAAVLAKRPRQRKAAR
jgi:hypothetical protein